MSYLLQISGKRMVANHSFPDACISAVATFGPKVECYYYLSPKKRVVVLTTTLNVYLGTPPKFPDLYNGSSAVTFPLVEESAAPSFVEACIPLTVFYTRALLPNYRVATDATTPHINLFQHTHFIVQFTLHTGQYL